MRYQVVDDNLREGEADELINDLIAGKTIHVQGVTNSDLSAYYGRLLKHGRRLRRKQKILNGKEGFVVWAVPESGGNQDR